MFTRLAPRVNPVFELVRHEEYVEIDDVTRKPIDGTRTAFLHLKAPDGRIIRAEIPHADLDPVLAMMFPKDFAKP